MPAKVTPTHLKGAPAGLERLIFFSDAVFAIAITLLALELRLPEPIEDLSDAQLLWDLLAAWPKYLAYGVSFLVIGSFWMGHHRKFRFIRYYDRRLLLLNLVLLMSVAFIPFPTAILSESGNRVATIFYALAMSLAGLLSAVIWWYAAYRAWLIDPTVDPLARRRELLSSLILPGVFVLSIGLCYLNNDLAKFSWLLMMPAAFALRAV